MCFSPFTVVWKVSNKQEEDKKLNCSSRVCVFTNCWEYEDDVVVVRIPGIVPMPLNDEGKLPVILYHHKRDFGITAAPD